MRILICYPWLKIGGAPNTAITLAKGLKEREHEVFFFTRGGEAYESRLAEAGIPVITAPHSSRLRHLYHLNPKAYRILCNALKDHSIDVIHTFHPYSYILALFAGPVRNIPVVFTAVWFQDPMPLPSYPSRVIFVAEEFRDHAAGIFRGSPREMLVLPNRLDLDLFHPGIDHGEFSRSRGLPDTGWKLAFMSRIDSIKFGSLCYALEAVRLLAKKGRDVVLAIAGDGSLFGELEKLSGRVNRDAGREVVRLLGTVMETPEFLSWSDIVIGIGRSAFEGMACGKPTLVVGENGLAGVVEPDKVDELMYHNFAGRNLKAPVEPSLLADTVERIMKDRDLYNGLSGFSRIFVIENYDYRAGAERLERVYEDALKDPPLGKVEKLKLLLSCFFKGYLPRCYVAWRLKARVLIGRGRPEDFSDG